MDCPLAEVMATKEHLFWPFNQRSPIRNAEHLTSEPPNSSSLLASDESVSLPVVIGHQVPAGSKSSTLFCVDLAFFQEHRLRLTSLQSPATPSLSW